MEGRTADLQTEVWATAMRRQKPSYSEEKGRLLAKSYRPPLSGPLVPGLVLVPEGVNPKPLLRISERSRRSATSVNALSVHVLVYHSERMHASTKWCTRAVALCTQYQAFGVVQGCCYFQDTMDTQ